MNNKIDCNKVLNYVAETDRMCKSFGCNCDDCPLGTMSCDTVENITQEHIDAVQKWSDEHPRETMAEHFFKIFPNAPKSKYESPVMCPWTLGFEQTYCGGDVKSCKECWNRPYKGEQL